MASRSNWARRRWLDFRQGHAIYLVFLMTFANFVTIQYALLVDRIPSLSSIFANIGIFAVIFVAAYIPIAILVGYWHRKSQMRVEQEAIFNENVIGARMWLFMLELIEGKVSEKEKNEMRKMLARIINKQPEDREAELEKKAEETTPVDHRQDDRD